ncbi:OsmC family protein [Cellulomonas sp. zg-ZUI222]|uniref:OsmC family protein n=1 Tax=Cellulomonas wangleii TaxID=2816956 RepID=A0ABX8D336_9CELL|nr:MULTISPECIES: OsmC family protein [Cellulomonas]MBO0900254.1 OsmC family protein [Cellulomonas sp. zg-ZUI22]MBO0920832.1 OsmC family protein [Cellulomonas wangleii]MBO0926572.1 OsmC family protein [Cellulomonas wangleii]QVI60866.1 OsmC family protein [Cellulomonas wangleii]
MAQLLHQYSVDLTWTGAGAAGTSTYTSYGRDHTLSSGAKPPLPGTSDPHFRGAPDRWSPEDLLVGALAQCHMLWFLHLAAAAGVVVIGYEDAASGTMRIESAGQGHFTEVVLRPRVVVRSATLPDGRAVDAALLDDLHRRAHEHCFIARSVNFTVRHEPAPVVVGAG